MVAERVEVERLATLSVCRSGASHACEECRDACKVAASATYREVFVTGNVYVLAVALDSGGQPENSMRADALLRLASMSRARGIQHLYNQDATALSVRRAMREIGAQVAAGDNFVFVFAGERARLAGAGAFCLPDGVGNASCSSSWMKDEEFAHLLTTALHPRARLFLLMESVGNGGPVDLSSSQWACRQAVQVAHCRRSASSERPLVAGARDLSEAVLWATEKLRCDGHVDYSVSQLCDTMLAFGGCSNYLAAQSSLGASCDRMQWPLVPRCRAHQKATHVDADEPPADVRSTLRGSLRAREPEQPLALPTLLGRSAKAPETSESGAQTDLQAFSKVPHRHTHDVAPVLRRTRRQTAELASQTDFKALPLQEASVMVSFAEHSCPLGKAEEVEGELGVDEGNRC